MFLNFLSNLIFGKGTVAFKIHHELANMDSIANQAKRKMSSGCSNNFIYLAFISIIYLYRKLLKQVKSKGKNKHFLLKGCYSLEQVFLSLNTQICIYTLYIWSSCVSSAWNLNVFYLMGKINHTKENEKWKYFCMIKVMLWIWAMFTRLHFHS